MTKVYGAALSPYVRKVLISLELKGVIYEIESFSPLSPPENYLELSPLGKIPAFQDDQITLCDSTVICEYLEERYPEPSLLPDSMTDRARCRWLEEYADSRLRDVTGPPLFFERIVKPMQLQQEPDDSIVRNAIDKLIPTEFDYLETQVPGQGFLFDSRLTLADIALVSVLINARYADCPVDNSRWPKLAAYMDFICRHPVIAARLEKERGVFAGL